MADKKKRREDGEPVWNDQYVVHIVKTLGHGIPVLVDSNAGDSRFPSSCARVNKSLSYSSSG